MIDLYVTRHGKTVWNEQFRMQGQKNSPLTSEGISGAIKLGEFFSDVNFSRCYTSPMPRAIHTSSLILKGREIPIEISPLVAEMNLSSWEGLQRDDAKNLFPSEFDMFRHHPENFYPVDDDAESFYQVIKRAEAFLKKIEALPNGTAPILCVTHCILLQSITMITEGRSINSLRDGIVDQTSPFHLRYENGSWTTLMRNGIPTV